MTKIILSSNKADLTQLEESLIKHLDALLHEDFAAICDAISLAQAPTEKLLEAARPKVETWLCDDKISDVEDLVSIAVAYSQNQVPCPEYELLETSVLKRA